MNESFSFKKKNHLESKDSIEMRELFRASLGFDFIFSIDESGEKQCYCIEFNGADSGISGVQSIPKEQISNTRKILADIRNTRTRDRHEYIDKARDILSDIDTGIFSVTDDARGKIDEFLKRSIRKRKLLVHSETNPDFFEDIANDKILQDAYIPESNKPRLYVEGATTKSKSGYWICKPRIGRVGEGILIVSNKQFEEQVVSNAIFQEHYIAQEFIQASGADKAPTDDFEKPAAMRLLIDFRYLENDTIEPIFEIGYQRISPLPSTMLKHLRESSNVVNKARGATSANATDEELALARPIAYAIIQNLASAYRNEVSNKTIVSTT